jgi:hypothetical protein
MQLPAASVIEEDSIDHTDEFEIIEVVETEEVTSFTEIMPVTHHHLRSKMSLRYSVDSLKKMD